MDELHHLLTARAQGALDQLIDTHIDSLHRLATLIIGAAGSPEDVEEAVADTFTRAWNQISEFDPSRTTLQSWLLMLTKYTALDRRRRLLRSRFNERGEVRVLPLESSPEPVGDATPEAELLWHEDRAQLHRALDELPATERDLLIRRYFFEEPIADMARDLGLTRTAIDNRLWRARQSLKRLLTAPEEVQKGVR